MAPSSSSTTSSGAAGIPLLYTLFFLWIEPLSTAVGAYFAHFAPVEYMRLTQSLSLAAVPPTVSTRETIVVSQLANLYFVFALNEALVLRATSDVRVWKVFLLGLLIADFGHLYSCAPMGLEIYWRFWDWNEIYWGNLGFVYVGATMRTLFLLGVGLGGTGAGAAAAAGKGGKVKR